MAIAQKIIKRGNRINIIETSYRESFNGIINRKGRPKRNFELMSDERLKKCKDEKIRLLKKYNRKLEYIISHNIFNYFITIRGIDSDILKKFLGRVRKSDKELKYLTLASWSKELNMHYHILFYTNLSNKDLQKKMKNIVDYKIESVYYQKGLMKYFKKNINYDIIYVLKQNSKDDKNLRKKQIEILKYGKLINISKKVSTSMEIKNPTHEQLNYIRSSYRLCSSFDYKLLGSNVRVEQYIKEV